MVMRKYFENLTTVGLVVCAGMFLCSCGNKVKIKENTVDKGGSVVVIATPKSEMIVYSPQPYSTGETVPQGKENESIGYKTGAFEQLHETFEKKYSEGYQSLSKESLIDVYGDRESEYLEDGIGFVATEDGSYNQLFVLKGLSEENGKYLVEAIVNPVLEDPTVENVNYSVYRIEDLDVICIGDNAFVQETKEVLNGLFGGAESE